MRWRAISARPYHCTVRAADKLVRQPVYGAGSAREGPADISRHVMGCMRQENPQYAVKAWPTLLAAAWHADQRKRRGFGMRFDDVASIIYQTRGRDASECNREYQAFTVPPVEHYLPCPTKRGCHRRAHRPVVAAQVEIESKTGKQFNIFYFKHSIPGAFNVVLIAATCTAPPCVAPRLARLSCRLQNKHR
jgi:hypothetical protein